MILESRSAAQTHTVGRLLGESCRGNEVILLEGSLGAGKTTLTQGLAAGLGVTVSVVSPTFVVLREYEGRLPLYHFDFYRLEGASRAVDLEFEEYLSAGGVTVIEWPSYAVTLLPHEALRVTLAVEGADRRRLTLTASGERATALLAALAVHLHGLETSEGWCG